MGRIIEDTLRRESRKKAQTGLFPPSPSPLAIKNPPCCLACCCAWCWRLLGAGSLGSPSKGSSPGALALPFPCSGEGAGGSRGCKWDWSSCQLRSSMGIDVRIVWDTPLVNFPITVRKAEGIKGGGSRVWSCDVSCNVP